ncbi:FAD binding domain-containing protein [Beijerinckia indica]|uniref:Monooxygenase FAD-binding n=1 Tax=Beijerinckia indica subsp. indica (strain ATCC 9039 / DSM 1715 / NCIMB 8712) TaxID=395963 RepID=B2IF05_BEII9|nr:FAD binding domain-containing protein [Beijerinckia indica]ACB94196.1 monooxygenase FAD-binding [Beijerinckia indica subsp. indica ATCC 9039]
MTKWRIRIVGGSLGGLFAAALLRRDGHDVRIYERSAGGLAGRGAGLVSQPDISSILRAVGCEHVAQIGVVAKERIYFDRDGGIAERYPTPQMQISWDYLYNTFRAFSDGEAYSLGRSVRSVAQDETGALLRFEDGAEDHAGLVIGADGVGSVVREAVIGQPSPSLYAGYVAWRGLFPEQALPKDAAEILLDRFAFYTMPRSHILGYVVAGPNGEMAPGKRRYNWVWYRPAPGRQGLDEALTDAKGQIHRYSLAPGALSQERREGLLSEAAMLLPPPFAAAVGAEPQPFIQAIFDFEAPKMAKDCVALLGDAAFVVRPHTAMGVAKAAGDALALRIRLAESADIESALVAYDRDRRPVGVSIAARGRQLGKALE